MLRLTREFVLLVWRSWLLVLRVLLQCFVLLVVSGSWACLVVLFGDVFVSCLGCLGW